MQHARRTVSDTMMTKEIAYTKPLTCKMWALFGKYAAQHGYKPYGEDFIYNTLMLNIVCIIVTSYYFRVWEY